MPARKTVVHFLLLLLVVITTNFIVIFYYGVPETQGKEYSEIINRQSELIARQSHNISRLQHKLHSLQQQISPNKLNTPPSFEKEDGIIDNRALIAPIKTLPPPIYMITPTYARWTQKADMTRLSHTLMHVPNLVWIVVEDSVKKTELVTNFLNKRKHVLKSVHLNIRTETSRRLRDGEPVWHKNRGVEQRNKALQWIRENAAHGQLEGGERGVVYFGDDDNTYDIEIFNEMRYTKTVSVWLVGLSGGLRFEGPTCHNGRVTGWYTMWGFERAFQVDMAGFAISLRLLLDNPDARIDPNAHRGYLETSILEELVTLDELEPRPDNCSKVLVWHTRTEVPNMKHEDKLIQRYQPSNPLIET